jgi:hypothetical protein
MDIREKYQLAVEKSYNAYYHSFFTTPLAKENEDHIKNLAISVLMTRDKVQIGGGFVSAIVNNDLIEAVSRADSSAILGLRFFVHCVQFVNI